MGLLPIHLKSKLLKDRAFGLVDFLILMAFTTTLVTTMTSQSTEQYKKLKGYAERADADKFKTLLSWRLSSPTVCAGNLSSVRVNIGSPSRTNVSINTLRYGDASSPVLASRGSRIPSVSSNLVVNDIVFKNASLITGNQYDAVVELSFNPSTMAPPLAPVSVPVKVIAGGAGGRVTDCTSTGSSIFEAQLVDLAGPYTISGRSSSNDVNLANFDSTHSLVSVQALCSCWDNDGHKWSRVTIIFTDSRGNSGGAMLNQELCFTNSSNGFLDDERGHANYDTNTATFPNMYPAVARIRLFFERSSTDCDASAFVKAYR